MTSQNTIKSVIEEKFSPQSDLKNYFRLKKPVEKSLRLKKKLKALYTFHRRAKASNAMHLLVGIKFKKIIKTPKLFTSIKFVTKKKDYFSPRPQKN